MAVIFVSRHPGAREWMRRQPMRVDRWVSHLQADEVERGDTVIGVLPMHLAAQVCAKGARFLAMELDLPAQCRGQELSSEMLDGFECRLQEYVVTRSSGEV